MKRIDGNTAVIQLRLYGQPETAALPYRTHALRQVHQRPEAAGTGLLLRQIIHCYLRFHTAQADPCTTSLIHIFLILFIQNYLKLQRFFGISKHYRRTCRSILSCRHSHTRHNPGLFSTDQPLCLHQILKLCQFFSRSLQIQPVNPQRTVRKLRTHTVLQPPIRFQLRLFQSILRILHSPLSRHDFILQTLPGASPALPLRILRRKVRLPRRIPLKRPHLFRNILLRILRLRQFLFYL